MGKGLLAVALDREPHGNEMTSAMETVKAVRRSVEQDADSVRGDPTVVAAQRVVSKFLGRAPSREERAKVSKYVRERQASARKAKARLLAVASANPEHEAWSRLYHALFNSAEFRYRN